MSVQSAGQAAWARVSYTLTVYDADGKEMKIPADELARAKEFLVGNFRLSHERVTSKLFFYGQTMLSFGRLVSPDEQVAGIKAVTAADVQAVAKAIFRPRNRSISWVVPDGRESSK